MRLWLAVSVLLSWPLVLWQSFRARRRLRAYALPAADRPLTLERVA